MSTVCFNSTIYKRLFFWRYSSSKVIFWKWFEILPKWFIRLEDSRNRRNVVLQSENEQYVSLKNIEDCAWIAELRMALQIIEIGFGTLTTTMKLSGTGGLTDVMATVLVPVSFSIYCLLEQCIISGSLFNSRQWTAAPQNSASLCQ